MAYESTGNIYAIGAASYAARIALDVNLNDQVFENIGKTNGVLEYCERAAIAIHVLDSTRVVGVDGWYPVDACEGCAEYLCGLRHDDGIIDPETLVQSQAFVGSFNL